LWGRQKKFKEPEVKWKKSKARSLLYEGIIQGRQPTPMGAIHNVSA
jgi:hypothetical protein